MKAPWLLLGFALTGCGMQLSTVPRRDGLTPATLEPPRDTAIVVFVGKSFRSALTREANEGVRIADERGRIAGELAPGNWIVAEVEPGRRCWYAWLDVHGGAPEVAAACGELTAGARYFVRVGQRNALSWGGGGALKPSWEPGTMIAREQDPTLGFVLEPALARETEARFASRIERVIREGEAKIATGDDLTLQLLPTAVN